MSMTEIDLFPHPNHPIRLEFGEKKNITICWFECEEHLQKYLNRSKLDKRTVKINYRDEPPVTSKTNKRSVEPKSKPKGDGSSGTNKRRTSSLDTTTNTVSPANSTKRKRVNKK